ncbi:MAG TPA: hypothetical protein VNZ67_07205, partial [bacterium]|nr:hypothetical protein [bacterium]
LNVVTQQSPCAPNVGATEDPNQEWHDTTTLFFNIIYSADDAHWFSVPTNVPAIPGEPVGTLAGPDTIPYSATHLYSYTWNIAAITPASIQNGNKFIRVECFRLDPNGNPMQHYAYHEIQEITTP